MTLRSMPIDHNARNTPRRDDAPELTYSSDLVDRFAPYTIKHKGAQEYRVNNSFWSQLPSVNPQRLLRYHS